MCRMGVLVVLSAAQQICMLLYCLKIISTKWQKICDVFREYVCVHMSTAPWVIEHPATHRPRGDEGVAVALW